MVNLICDADGYDPLDPMGNITIRWDVTTNTDAIHHVIFFVPIKILAILFTEF